MRNFYWLLVSAFFLLLDQLTKVIAQQQLELYQSVKVLPFFNFTLAYNQGAAFSFLRDAGGWQRWLFTGIAAVISILIIVWLKSLKPGQKYLAFGLASILGGALGNVVDRVHYSYVVDFLDFYVNDWHWPTFNVADIAICIGGFFLILDLVRNR